MIQTLWTGSEYSKFYAVSALVFFSMSCTWRSHKDSPRNISTFKLKLLQKSIPYVPVLLPSLTQKQHCHHYLPHPTISKAGREECLLLLPFLHCLICQQGSESLSGRYRLALFASLVHSTITSSLDYWKSFPSALSTSIFNYLLCSFSAVQPEQFLPVKWVDVVSRTCFFSEVLKKILKACMNCKKLHSLVETNMKKLWAI